MWAFVTTQFLSPSIASDPAFLDSSLLRKLRTNREVAVSRLEEVISKYANRQEDTEELERKKRQEKKEKGVRKHPFSSALGARTFLPWEYRNSWVLIVADGERPYKYTG